MAPDGAPLADAADELDAEIGDNSQTISLTHDLLTREREIAAA